ncbi:protein-arginine deiminase family protein [Spongiactinospora sp. 9N601]|uniref:protein-arginine deiminase family protein n=1 Tax=Spongiactinospora sp. 9N601 TaxID=3375149 RepID=UPI00378FACB2
MRRRWVAVVTTLVVTTLVVTGSLLGTVPGWAAAAPVPDLRADVDRDGRIDLVGPGDEEGEERWTQARGAVFLPNLDDSERRCTVDSAELDEPGLWVDQRLAACNDAADSRVNGQADTHDLARMRTLPMPELSGSALGQVRLNAPAAAKVRIFVRHEGGYRPVLPEGRGWLTAAELRGGVEFALEGRDIVRDPALWDGLAMVTLTVTDHGRTGEDRVQLREAPLLLQNDLQPAVRVIAGRPGKGPGWPTDGSLPPLPPGFPGEWSRFAGSLRKAARTASPEFIAGTAGYWKDVWWQDIFEPMTASMPGPRGTRTMRVLVRSANLLDLPGKDGKTHRTLRPSGRLLFRHLRGPGVAVVQGFTDVSRDPLTDLRNATGNIESLPPYDGYPNGRMVYGSGATMRPDPAFIRLLIGQGHQPPVVIDTSWLLVGHADETMHVIRADNDRGWTLMVADPRLAVHLMKQAQARGAGGARLLGGTRSGDQPTIDQYLANDRALAANDAAAGHIDQQIAVMLAATGLRAADLIRVPVLFARNDHLPLLRAFTPAIPNGLSLTERDFAAPDPHGPVVDGRDLFRRATEQALASRRVRVSWVEDYSWAHAGGGEVHCTTNALRAIEP